MRFISCIQVDKGDRGQSGLPLAVSEVTLIQNNHRAKWHIRGHPALGPNDINTNQNPVPYEKWTKQLYQQLRQREK